MIFFFFFWLSCRLDLIFSLLSYRTKAAAADALLAAHASATKPCALSARSLHAAAAPASASPAWLCRTRQPSAAARSEAATNGAAGEGRDWKDGGRAGSEGKGGSDGSDAVGGCGARDQRWRMARSREAAVALEGGADEEDEEAVTATRGTAAEAEAPALLLFPSDDRLRDRNGCC